MSWYNVLERADKAPKNKEEHTNGKKNEDHGW